MKVEYLFFAVVISIISYLFLWPSEKDRLNEQMAELCEKDKKVGMHIYETVTLPLNMFDENGHLKRESSKEEAIGRKIEYLTNYASGLELRTEVDYIVPRLKSTQAYENKFLRRTYKKLVRTADQKVLAESVKYYRSGGERWNAGRPSSDSCPEYRMDILQKTVFKENK